MKKSNQFYSLENLTTKKLCLHSTFLHLISLTVFQRFEDDASATELKRRQNHVASKLYFGISGTLFHKKVPELKLPKMVTFVPILIFS